jgi:sortase A
MRRRHARLYAAVPTTAAIFSLYVALSAAWIPVKAEVAQWLIERSWRHSLSGRAPEPPWPWADTAPAALLRVPRHGVRLHVLRGASGRNLAFGPVVTDAGPDNADRVISGHRDTHFDFLRDLREGDLLEWTDRRGGAWYRVEELEVIDSRTHRLVIERGIERITLVTCFPFDGPATGGPLRYVVTAYPLKPR